MVQLLAGIISLRRVLEANPGRSHGSADTLPLRHIYHVIIPVHRVRVTSQVSSGNVTMLSQKRPPWATMAKSTIVFVTLYVQSIKCIKWRVRTKFMFGLLRILIFSPVGQFGNDFVTCVNHCRIHCSLFQWKGSLKGRVRIHYKDIILPV